MAAAGHATREVRPTTDVCGSVIGVACCRAVVLSAMAETRCAPPPPPTPPLAAHAWPPSADAPWLTPQQLALLYLFNPFAVLSCVAGSSTPAENAALLVAVAGGCLRNGPLAGFGLAAAAYLGLQPLLMLVRCCARVPLA